MTETDPRAVRVGLAVFDLLTRGLPARFRRQYADDLREAYVDEARDAYRDGGTPGLVSATARSASDVLRSALDLGWRLTEARSSIQPSQHQEPIMNALWQDVRHGCRGFVRQPGFTIVALLTLSVGIAANTAIFTLLNAALIRPLPYVDPDRLVRIWGEHAPTGSVRANVNPLDALDWRREAPAIEALGVWTGTTQPLTGAGDAVAIPVAFVTSEFFRVLGVDAAQGRLFGPEHDAPGRETEVVVSDRFWRTTLAGDPAVVGRTIALLDVACTIVGVLPPAFASPGTSTAAEPLVWRPLVITPANGRGGHFARVIARLAPGATINAAQAQIDAVQERLEREFPATNLGQRGRVEPMQRAIAGDTGPALLMLMVTVGLVLMIACANVANLMLARGTLRAREIAVRGALGASGRRLVRQLMTESLLLGLLAAVAGTLLGTLAIEAIPRWLAELLPTVTPVRLDGRVLAFTILLSCATVVLFGLAPAVLASRRDFRAALADGSPGAGSGSHRLQSWLLVVETALATLLLVGATLLVESLVRLQRVHPGFSTENVMTLRVGVPRTRYPSGIHGAAFFSRLAERLSALPGVSAAGGVNMSPLTGRWSCDSFGLADRPAPPEGTEPCAEARVATPGYFEAMGIPLLKGRLFGAGDTREAPRVIVISETMARQYWPDGSAIGRQFKWGSVGSDQPWLTVIGVVGDVRHYSLEEPAAPEVYVPVEQSGTGAMTLALRTSRDAATLTTEVRRAIASLDPALAVSEMFTTRELVTRSTALPLFRTQLLGVFALVALGLAVVGVYGVLSFLVAQRRREIGIRLALGATPGRVAAYIVRIGLTSAVIGTAIGLMAAIPVMRLLRDQLYEVSPGDPLALIVAPAALMAAALAACYLPARRATRLQPIETLRGH